MIMMMCCVKSIMWASKLWFGSFVGSIPAARREKPSIEKKQQKIAYHPFFSQAKDHFQTTILV